MFFFTCLNFFPILRQVLFHFTIFCIPVGGWILDFGTLKVDIKERRRGNVGAILT